MTTEVFGPEHPFHIGFFISIGLTKGMTEEDARVALAIVREHFPQADLKEKRMNGWDVSSTSYDADIS